MTDDERASDHAVPASYVAPLTGEQYDVFVSYSHAADARVAAALQSGLQRFAKPWYRRRALTVFRDETSLTASPGLWSSIQAAVDASRAFVLMASPEAAASKWVEREVAHWRATKPIDRLFIAVTRGELVWDAEARDFDWTRTTAVPRALAGAFTEEPLFVDLRFARDEDKADTRNPSFRTAVARLSAPLRGLGLDDLISEDVRLHRRAVRLAWGAAGALAILTIAALSSTVLAIRSGREAERRATSATARRVALQGMVADLVEEQPDLGLLLSLQSLKLEPSTVAYRNILTTLASVNEAEIYLRGPAGRSLQGVTFSADGTRIAAITSEGTILSWDLAAPRAPPREVPSQEQQGVYLARDGSVTLVPLEGDGVAVDRASGMAVTTLGPVRTFRFSGAVVAELPVESERILSAAISPGGELVALGERDGAISLWDARTGRAPLRRLRRRAAGDEGSGIGALAFSPGGRRLAAAEEDGSLVLWELDATPPRARLVSPLHTQPNRLVFNGDGSSLAVVYGNMVGLWNVSSLHSELLNGPAGLVHDVAFSQDGSRLAAVGGGAVVVWNFGEREMFRRPFNSPHGSSVVAAAMLPDGRRGRTLDYDRLLVEWDFSRIPTNARSFQLDSERGALVAFSEGGRWLVTAELDQRRVVRWDLAGSTPMREADVALSEPIDALALSASGSVLALAGETGMVRVLRFESDSARTVWSGKAEEPVWTLALDRDGVWLAGGYASKGFFLRSLRSGQQRSTRQGHKGRVTSLAFNGKGDLLASGGDDQRVGVWRVPDLSSDRTLRLGHSQAGVTHVAFNPVTGQLLSSGADAVIQLWPSADKRDEPLPLPLVGHERPAYALAFSPDGRRLLAGDGKWNVFLWEIDPELWRRRACYMVNRNLTDDEWRLYVGTVAYQQTCEDIGQ